MKNIIRNAIFFIYLAPMVATAQEIPFQPDTSLLKVDIFEVSFRPDSSVVLRTNRHLKYFNPFESLFIEVLCIPEGFKDLHNPDNAEVMRRTQTFWAISAISLKKKGTYLIRFYAEPKEGKVQKLVEYSFLHTSKQPIDQHYISMIYKELDKD
jgi:hypothetical protein